MADCCPVWGDNMLFCPTCGERSKEFELAHFRRATGQTLAQARAETCTPAGHENIRQEGGNYCYFCRKKLQEVKL